MTGAGRGPGPPDAVVVGGGHNGLVAAAYLARAGVRTVVLERRETVGGALATAELEPGVWGPALAHTVGRLWRKVARDLDLAGHGFRPLVPPVRVLAPRPDGRPLTLWGDPARSAGELRRFGADGEGFLELDRKVRALASFLAHVHAATPPDLRGAPAAGARAALGLLRALRALGERGRRELLRVLPMAVADLVAEAVQDEALRGALAARGVRYTAMGVRSAGTAAWLLADSAGTGGGAAGETVFVRGGPGRLAEALAGAARSFGAVLRTGAEVAAITTRDGRVTGVALASGEEVPARVVVSAVDPKRTLLGLLDPAALGPTLVWRAGNLRLSGATAKVNLALGALPRFAGVSPEGAPERLAGRIVVAPSLDYLERAFDASKYGRPSEAPFLEATIPTLTDPSLAPEGRHVMSVVVQYAPYHLREGDWDRERDALGDAVLRTLDGVAPGLSSLVTSRQVLTPLDLERDYGLTGGHPLHGEPSLDQFFAWRPLLGHARYRLALEGLYLAGSGAHPGGGVTGIPGANAAREVLADFRARGWAPRPRLIPTRALPRRPPG